jgi:hypothetical protein
MKLIKLFDAQGKDHHYVNISHIVCIREFKVGQKNRLEIMTAINTFYIDGTLDKFIHQASV